MIIDYSSKRRRQTSGSFYTALSRVKFGDNFFLKDFKPEYIAANPEVERKLLSMKTFAPYNFKKIYLSDYIFNTYNEIKLGYININSLFTSFSDVFLNVDENLLKLDLLCVVDTRLTKTDDTAHVKERLSNWRIINRYVH